jgi:hypothetical protein
MPVAGEGNAVDGLPRNIDLIDLSSLKTQATGAEVASFAGREALRLENGLALWPEAIEGDLSLRVEIAAEGPCYAGIAFHAADAGSFELVYAQPHTSGLWDALQYDPVFRGSNTWQIYHGPAYQRAATVPMGSWFTLRVDVVAGQVVASVDGQAPLRVGRLMHGRTGGRLGVWTYLPAFFAGLQVARAEAHRLGPPPEAPECPRGTIRRWELEGVGPIKVEENATLNLNRHLDWEPGAEAMLTTSLVALRDTEAELQLGYSDELVLELDGRAIHSGGCTFAATGGYEGRGYIRPGPVVLKIPVAAGAHALRARLRTAEPFGWGLAAAVLGEGIETAG